MMAVRAYAARHADRAARTALRVSYAPADHAARCCRVLRMRLRTMLRFAHIDAQRQRVYSARAKRVGSCLR